MMRKESAKRVSKSRFNVCSFRLLLLLYNATLIFVFMHSDATAPAMSLVFSRKNTGTLAAAEPAFFARLFEPMLLFASRNEGKNMCNKRLDYWLEGFLQPWNGILPQPFRRPFS